MWLQRTGWQRKNHSSYWHYTSIFLWEFWCQKYYQKLQWRPETFNHQIGPSKTEISLGFELFVLWFHQGHSGTMKVQLLFASLLWYFCHREFHIIALHVQCFWLQKTGRNPVEKSLLLMTRGAQCSVILVFKKEIYCTYEDLHLCLPATLTKMGESEDTVVKRVLAHHMTQECIGFTLLIPFSASCKPMLVHPL